MNDCSPVYTTLWEVEKGQFFVCDSISTGRLYARTYNENIQVHTIVCIDNPTHTWDCIEKGHMALFPVTLVEEVVISYKV